MTALDNDVMSKPLGDANARAEKPQDERMPLTDDFDFAPNAQSHRHQAMERGICAVNVLDDAVCAGGQFVEAMVVHNFSGCVHGEPPGKR